MIKHTITTIKFLLSILLCIMLSIQLQSCGDPDSDPPCTDTKYETRNISADDLSKVPYTGFDTLYFLNKQGDTCIVRGTGKQYTYEIEDGNGNPACPNPPIRYSNQVYSIQFVSVKGGLSFELLQKYNPNRIYIDRGPSYSVSFNTMSSTVDVAYNGDPYYIDSLIVNNKTYYKIAVFLSAIENEFQAYDTTYKLLYNKSNGILYIKSQRENEEFSIISKP